MENPQKRNGLKNIFLEFLFNWLPSMIDTKKRYRTINMPLLFLETFNFYLQ